MYRRVGINVHDGLVFLIGLIQRRIFCPQYITDKFIRQEKYHKAKPYIKKLLHNAGAFSYKHTTAFSQIIRAMCGVPYFSAFHHINNIIVMAPGVLVFIFQRTVVQSDKAIAAVELPEMFRVGNDIAVKVEQVICLKGKNKKFRGRRDTF
jgi:hypothetical protein